MRRALFLLAAGAAISAPVAGQAQGVCGGRADIVKALEKVYGERKSAAALSASGAIVELYTAADGSWTLLYTLPGGPTCLLAAGEGWEPWTPAPKPPDMRTH